MIAFGNKRLRPLSAHSSRRRTRQSLLSVNQDMVTFYKSKKKEEEEEE